jgi:hypothetical protein
MQLMLETVGSLVYEVLLFWIPGSEDLMRNANLLVLATATLCFALNAQDGLRESKSGRPAIEEASVGSQKAELDRIGNALANRVLLFSGVVKGVNAEGRLKIQRDELRKSIESQIKKGLGDSIKEEALEALCEKVEAFLLNELADNLAESYFDAYFSDLKVRSYYDLSSPDLPDDFKSLVKYFKDEYGQDVTTARVLIADGMPHSYVGKHIGRNVGDASRKDKVSLEIGEQQVDIEVTIKIQDLSEIVSKSLEKIFGSKDIVMVDANLFKKRREEIMNFVAHELRHMLDQNDRVAAFSNFEANADILRKQLQANKEVWGQREAVSVLNSPELAKFIEAATILSIKDNPAVAELPQFKAHIKNLKQKVAESGAQSFLEGYVYRNNEHEQRAFLEQARYAKVAQGWDQNRYLQSVTRDLPYEMAIATDGEGEWVTLPSGEKVFTGIFPPPPWDILFHSRMFESNNKVSVPLKQ